MKTVDKPWGKFIQFSHNEPTTVKILIVEPGEELSIQYHYHRTEYWYITKGTCEVIRDKEIKDLKEGDLITIHPQQIHSIKNISKKPCEILEISTGQFDEKDIFRVKDKYNREEEE